MDIGDSCDTRRAMTLSPRRCEREKIFLAIVKEAKIPLLLNTSIVERGVAP